jgi:hypothetical protein
MGKTKMVLCSLLAVVLIFPLAFAIAPAVQADPEEPQGEAKTTYIGPPTVVGWYYMKGTFTEYDWTGNKRWQGNEGWFHVYCQANNLVQILIYMGGGFGATSPQRVSPKTEQTPPQMEPPGVACAGANGYVGSRLRDNANLKVKNKPGLSCLWQLGTYPNNGFQYWMLNASIKLDSKTPYAVKSIKGTINGWGFWTPYNSDGSFSHYRIVGKFTAKPCPVPWWY